MVFEPWQFKSSDNRGTFDEFDDRFRFSRASKEIPKSWEGPEQSKLDDLIYTLQDKHVDTRRVVQAIRKKSGEIADEFDPYLQEELYHGRSAKGVKDFLDNELRPLLADMTARKVSMEDLEKYLHARHAEERNSQMAKINPGNDELQDGGSGMTTIEAHEYLARIKPRQRRALAALADRVAAQLFTHPVHHVLHALAVRRIGVRQIGRVGGGGVLEIRQPDADQTVGGTRRGAGDGLVEQVLGGAENRLCQLCRRGQRLGAG